MQEDKRKELRQYDKDFRQLYDAFPNEFRGVPTLDEMAEKTEVVNNRILYQRLMVAPLVTNKSSSGYHYILPHVDTYFIARTGITHRTEFAIIFILDNENTLKEVRKIGLFYDEHTSTNHTSLVDSYLESYKYNHLKREWMLVDKKKINERPKGLRDAVKYVSDNRFLDTYDNPY